MNRIYLVSPLANKKESEEYCFGKCGKIQIAGIDFMEVPWLPCREINCQYEEKHLPFGTGEIMGEKVEVIVRKLK